MKLKAIASMCKKSKRIMLIDVGTDKRDVVQWVGDGTAFYPLYGMPYLEEDHIYTLFDVPEKEVPKMMFDHIKSTVGLAVSFSDTEADEREIDPHGLRLIMGGSIVQPYATSDGGGIFVDTVALAPINDALDYLTLHERRSSDGGLHIAVKNGLVLQGILFPMQIEDMQLMSRLMELCDMVRTNILNTPEPYSEKEQMTFDGEG